MRLVDFEVLVLHKMLKDRFDAIVIGNICSSIIEGYEYTGSGYFIKIRNKLIPMEREVISAPMIVGNSTSDTELLLGFVLFMEQKELVIECHSFGRKNLPNSIREHSVKLSD